MGNTLEGFYYNQLHTLYQRDMDINSIIFLTKFLKYFPFISLFEKSINFIINKL
jgi:hypothetical protein